MARFIQYGDITTAAARPALDLLSARLMPQLHNCGEQACGNIIWACGRASYTNMDVVDGCLT